MLRMAKTSPLGAWFINQYSNPSLWRLGLLSVPAAPPQVAADVATSFAVTVCRPWRTCAGTQVELVGRMRFGRQSRRVKGCTAKHQWCMREKSALRSCHRWFSLTPKLDSTTSSVWCPLYLWTSTKPPVCTLKQKHKHTHTHTHP